MIQIQNISLSYGNEKILENISCEIGKNESICFWGPSGSGKSSLLRLLMGFEIPSSGKIIIDGLYLNNKNIHQIRNKITWVPQNINLPVANTAELLELLNLSENQKNIFPKFLNKLGIENSLISKHFQEVSGGQKQRIVIAAVLSKQKPILLLDEPTSALDKESVSKLIKLVFHDLNITVVSASHDLFWSNANNKILKLN